MGDFEIVRWNRLDGDRKYTFSHIIQKAIFDKDSGSDAVVKANDEMDGFCLLEDGRPRSVVIFEPMRDKLFLVSMASPFADTNRRFHQLTGRTPNEELVYRAFREGERSGCHRLYTARRKPSGKRFLERLHHRGILDEGENIVFSKLPSPIDLDVRQAEKRLEMIQGVEDRLKPSKNKGIRL